MNPFINPSSSKLFSGTKRDFEDCFASDVNAILTPPSERRAPDPVENGGEHGGL
jgi:hypothetical protein